MSVPSNLVILIKFFTGIDSAYETPEAAEVVFDTSVIDIEESTELLVSYLVQHGFI